jgi:hypothetical protein
MELKEKHMYPKILSDSIQNTINDRGEGTFSAILSSRMDYVFYGDRKSLLYVRTSPKIIYQKNNRELVIFDLLKRKNITTRLKKRLFLKYPIDTPNTDHA